METPLTIQHLPKAILHIDGDAFFAAVEQSRNPALKGKPVVTGKERGIAASMSYEAKACGVTRGMRLSEIKRVCPQVVVLPSDYETYSLLSKRMFSIVRRYTSEVEEYSIDECFADITGLQRPLKGSYQQIAGRIKHMLDVELGFTFSVGLAPTKVVAKVGSKWKKPSGLTCIPGWEIHRYLQKLPVEKIWGIGAQTTAFLAKNRIRTALEFARLSERWIQQHLTKPSYEIWQELRGTSVLPLETKEKDTYQSVQKFKTFSPPSNDHGFVFSQLSKNIENACMKIRRYHLVAGSAICLLRTQDFRDYGLEVSFSRPTAFSHEVIHALRPLFNQLFSHQLQYRSTGVMLGKLREDANLQLNLFDPPLHIEKYQRIYQTIDSLRGRYGKHTVFLGASLTAQTFTQHVGERGDAPERKGLMFKGETTRRKLGIPMFVGKVT
ncbi:MAG: DNA polymerase IV [Nitrospirales bacterium]|nr:MAG: DNA polymerase IV [Nitrospirales bacterium]